MSKLIFSVAGEGRGHAARVATMADRLRSDHDMVILASGQAFEMLHRRYGERRLIGADGTAASAVASAAGPWGPSSARRVRVLPIPGVRFHYTAGRLDLARSIGAGLAFLAQINRHVRQVMAILERERPDLAVVDFEGLLPRAADRIGLPYLSLSHQHFITTFDLSALPLKLRLQAIAMRPAIWLHHTTQRETIVSGFFDAPIRPICQADPITVVGPLLRPEIRAAVPRDDGHLLSYLRETTPPAVLTMLQTLGRPVKVYGLGERPALGPLTFHAFDERTFVTDLATATAYVGAAGNQSLGEALHLGKPVLALPERKHFEQRINGHFIESMGCGACYPLERVTGEAMAQFLDRLAEYRQATAIRQGRMDGGPDVERRLEAHLGVACRVATAA